MAIGVGISGPRGGGGVPSLADPPSFEDALALYRADAGQTLIGGVLDSWADQSGNGYNMSASSAARRQYVSMNQGKFGFRDVLTFGAEGFRALGLPTAAMTQFTFDIVLQWVNGSGGYSVTWGNVNTAYPVQLRITSARIEWWIRATSGWILLYYTTANIGVTVGQTLRLTLACDFTQPLQADRYKIWRDGVAYTANSFIPNPTEPTSADNSTGQFSLVSTTTSASSDYPIGYIAIWDRLLTDTEIAENAAWKNQIWV